MKLSLACCLLFALTASPARLQTSAPPVGGIAQKLAYITANAKQQTPDPRPTELLQEEINGYFAAGSLKLPDGVQDLRTELHAQQVIGTAHVDFDRVRAGKHDLNPLLSIFSGVHDVRAEAYADGEQGTATVRIQSASLDGVNIPKFVLQMFIERYVQPKYPNIGIETRFHLPARIDQAIVGENKVVVTQR